MGMMNVYTAYYKERMNVLRYTRIICTLSTEHEDNVGGSPDPSHALPLENLCWIDKGSI